jgi:hypothetical protein
MSRILFLIERYNLKNKDCIDLLSDHHGLFLFILGAGCFFPLGVCERVWKIEGAEKC